jgi:hypothetical protein
VSAHEVLVVPGEALVAVGVRRFAVPAASAMVVAAAALVAAPAFAAPVHWPKFQQVTLTCPGRTAAVVTPGNGHFTPGFVVGTGQLLIPYRFVYTITGGGGTFTVTREKQAPLPSDAVACTFDQNITQDGTAYTVAAVVTAEIRGRP